MTASGKPQSARGAGVRGHILAALTASPRPLTAYQLLDRLRANGVNAPTTVYRALDRLVSGGDVHRLETLNAFVACAHRERCRNPAFAICRTCRSVTEFGSTPVVLPDGDDAEPSFAIERTTLELVGVCGRCRTNALARTAIDEPGTNSRHPSDRLSRQRQDDVAEPSAA